MQLRFVETTVFTRRIARFGLEKALLGLQLELLRDPLGGARVHYLYVPRTAVIYLLFVYGKQEQSTLTAEQKRVLKAVVDEIVVEGDSAGMDIGGER